MVHLSIHSIGMTEYMRFFFEFINVQLWSPIPLGVTMKTVLQINSSLFGQHGQSSRLAASLVQRLMGPSDRLIQRDLAADQVPHLTAQRFAAFTTAESERTADQREVVA